MLYLNVGAMVICVITVVCWGGEEVEEANRRAADEASMLHVAEALRQQDVAITFYGKVVDQADRPVDSAEVVGSITYFVPNAAKLFGETRAVVVQSDSQGCFKIGGITGRNLYIKNIAREGYEFKPVENPVGLYRYGSKHETYVPDPLNPVTFHVRKKGPGEFMMQERSVDILFMLRHSGKGMGHDFIQQRHISNVEKMGGDAGYVFDMKVTATFNAKDSTWEVMLAPGDVNGGLLLSDQLLYEAPADGYQPEYAFTAERRKAFKAKYIYLKSREPAIFTRIEIVGIAADDQKFRLTGQSVTNPYGERNLEQATDLPYEVEQKLWDEVQAAFRENRRPVKPDLSQVLRDYKEERNKAIDK